MAKTKVTAPVEGYSGPGPAGVVFTDGVAYTDDEAVLDYFRTAGYGVGPDRPARVKPSPPVDARDAATTTVGTALRDAAVDPRPDDFLPPTNAGQADPHGPLVVAPGIHAAGTQVVRPGPVHVEDLAAQQRAQTEQATGLLVENLPVDQVTGRFERADADGNGGSDTGPLGLSDPGSVVAVDTGDSAEVETSTLPDGTVDEPPASSASKGAWVKFARTRGASDQDLAGLTRDQIRATYGQ